MITIPKHFSQFMVTVYGEQGQAWIANLPSLMATLAEKWQIEVETAVDDLSYNFVATAKLKDNTPAILKVGVPNPELFTEMDALAVFNGNGAVKLLATDKDNGAMLMERVLPGTQLTSITDDDTATYIAANAMQTLWQPEPAEHTFRTVAYLASGLQRLRAQFDGDTGPLPAHLVTLAETMFDKLLQTAETAVLLHGDCHHMNILDAGGGNWKIIDPKGVIGEPAYEPAQFLMNPIPTFLSQPNPQQRIANRATIFANQLNLNRDRILAWAFCKAILSAWWSVEENHSPDWALTCAQLTYDLL
ncbi:MAG: phosphotransferase [Chloroflexi bacterium]|nr:phosphotransferase [Chloroflexota bacterium]